MFGKILLLEKVDLQTSLENFVIFFERGVGQSKWDVIKLGSFVKIGQNRT